MCIRDRYKMLRRMSWWTYFAVIAALLVVFTPLGWKVNGSYRWIHFGFMNLQPSEFAKLAILLVLEPYRVERLTSFTDPWRDSGGSGYQVVQAWIALASGGWYGQGIGAG